MHTCAVHLSAEREACGAIRFGARLSSKRPSAQTAEHSANKNETPYVPVRSAICIKSRHGNALDESVPHGYARKPVPDALYHS